MLAKPVLPVLQRGHPFAKGLVHAVVPYEGAGSYCRDLGTDNPFRTLSLSNCTWQVAPLGRVLYMTPTAYVQWPSLPVADIIPARFTFMVWFRAHVYNQRPVWGFTGSGGSNIANPFASYDGYLNFGDGSSYQVISALPVSIGYWNWYAVVDDGSYYTVIKDGAIVGSPTAITVNPGYSTDRTFQIGVSGFNSPYDDPNQGWHAAAYMYDWPMSLQEVTRLAADPFQMFRPRRLSVAAALTAAKATIRLTWIDNAEHEDGFSIERCTDGYSFSEIDTVGEDIETYDDEEVPTGSTYYYRVRATSTLLGFSIYSNVASIDV